MSAAPAAAAGSEPPRARPDRVAVPTHATAADDLDQLRLELTTDQVASVRWPVLAFAAFIVLLVARDAPVALTLSWIVVMVFGREWRVHLLRSLTAERSRTSASRLRDARLSVITVGLPQGATALFMVWLDLPLDAVLTMVLVSLTAGAVSTTSLIPGAFPLYAACVLLPIAAMWFAALDVFGIGLAALTLTVFGVQNRFARNNRRTFEESFRIRRENAELARQLGEARDRAEAATHARTRFIAAASHDLRQPVHALALQSAALTMVSAADDGREIVRGMSVAIQRLVLLLDALFDISRLDAGTLKCEPRTVNLALLLRSLAGSSRPLAELKGLELQFDGASELRVRTDPLVLERLLRNLLDNAIKYTDRGEVRLRLESVDGRARIIVADTGVGIAPEHQQRVFEEFFRIESARAAGGGGDHGGLGLGLAIVRRLADLLELRLTLQSAPGEGTRVVIDFPAALAAAADAEAAAPPAPAVSHAPSALDGLRVLVVDDDAVVLEATAVLLERLGCRVATAEDLAGALAAAEPAPDVVLSDCRLRNGETGVALVQQLVARHPDLAAVLVTGDTDPDRLREARLSGLPLLHKPVAAETLREVLESLAVRVKVA